MKNLWVRALQKGTLRSDRTGRFEMLYRVQDPWRMDSSREQHRFQETNRLIQREFGKVETLLEVGCGEGHQSRYLLEVCQRLHGIDVSEIAIQRAIAKCPTATFSQSDLQSYRPTAPFDLVVACEVLYYVQDVEGAISKMKQIARRGIVSYLDSGGCTLDAYFLPEKGYASTTIRLDDVAWKAVWW